MNKIRLAILLMLVAATVVVGGCGTKNTASQNSGKVRLGYFPNLTHAPALVGIDKGFFKEQLGTATLETKVFSAGPELVEAMAAGELDIAYVGPGPALSAYARGIGVNIISGVNDGGAVLVAAPNAGIASVRDLDGKKVAVPQLGNTQDISLRHLLLENGLKDKAKGGSVNIFQAAPADVLTMFVQGQVDAALVPEPWGSVLEKKAGAKLVLNWNQIWRDGRYPTTVLIVNKQFAEKNPDIVRAFLKGHVQAVQFINTNMAEAAQAANRQLKILTNKEVPEDILLSAFKRNQATTNIDLNILQEFADLSAESGYLKAKVKAEQIVNLKYLQ